MSNVARYDWWRASKTELSECPTLGVFIVIYLAVTSYFCHIFYLTEPTVCLQYSLYCIFSQTYRMEFVKFVSHAIYS